MTAKNKTQTDRYQVRKDRGGQTVVDTRTGNVWTGLTRPGALQLSDHLNRRNT